MKFACPKCKTKYSVADEKVPTHKTLRFTCRKCQNVFRLKRKPKSKEVRNLTAPGEPTEKEPEAATRVANLHEIMAVKKRSKTASVPDDDRPSRAAPVSPFVQQDEWFVLIKGKQEGPLTPDQVAQMYAQSRIDKRTYAWRDGMGDWVRLGVVPAFEELVAGDETLPMPAPRVRPPAAKEPPTEVSVGGPGSPGFDDRAETVERAALVRQTLAADAERQRAEKAKAIAAAEATRPMIKKDDPEASQDALVALVGEPTGEPMRRDDADPVLDDDEPTGQLDSPFDVASGFHHLDETQPGLELDEPSLRGPMAEKPPDYLQSSPGQETRVFMATAGIYKRRRLHKIAAVAGGIFAVLLVTFVVLDLTGTISLPGMGVMYDVTGLEDPNVDRAITRAEEKLQDEELSEEERVALEKRRAALRDRLLGGTKPKPRGGGARVASANTGAGAGSGSNNTAREAPSEVGIEEAEEVTPEEHDLTASIMGDDRKRTKGPKLRPPSEIQAPNLPDGLTQEAIFEVINKNQRAMSLCISQSMKAGENLAGKMEVEMSINASGQVGSASIQTARFHNSTIGNCTIKTVKRWRFPKFNGKPVTVIFPYVLSASL